MDKNNIYSKPDYKAICIWIVLFLGGFIYLLTGITHETFWYDESYSASIINHSISDIWKIAGSDSHPPLYFIALKIFSMIFGKTEFGLRLFSVFGVISLMALGIGPIRRALGKSTGLAYSFIVLITPVSLFMGQEARMYTWAAFFVTACTVYGYLAISQGNRYDWIKFGICTVFAAYIHYYALLAVAIANILTFIRVLLKNRQQLKKYLITAGISLICYIPWIYWLTSQISRISRDFWISPLSGITIINTLLYPFTLKFPPYPPQMYYAIPAFIIVLFIISRGLVSIIKKRFKEGKVVVFALLIYFLTLITGWIISLTIRPLFVERYSVPVIGLLLLAAAYGISKFKKRTFTIVVCILLTVSVIPFILQTEQQRFNGPMKEVTSYMNGNLKPDDIFIHTNEHTFGIFSYYFPGHKHYIYQEEGIKSYSGFDAFAPDGTSGRDLDGFIKGHKNIWLVTLVGSPGVSTVNNLLDSGSIIAQGKVERFILPYSDFAFTLRRVEPGPGKPVEPKESGKITIKFKNIKDKPGMVQVCLFNKEGYISDVSDNIYMVKYCSVKEAEDGVSFDDIPYGNYAVGAFHDQDKSGRLSTKNGLPTEGFGMTNTVKGIKMMPFFEACMFPFESSEKTVEIEMAYTF